MIWSVRDWYPKYINCSYKIENFNFKNGQKTSTDIFPKKIYRWPRGRCKVAQHCSLPQKCKSKPQWDITSHPSEWLSSKRPHTHTHTHTHTQWPQITNVGEIIEERKRSPVHYWWEGKLVQPLWETPWRFLKNLKIRIIIWFSNSIPGYAPEETKALSGKDTCTQWSQ